jgi:hypothetical protein
MTVTLFQASAGPITLTSTAPTVIVQLQLPNTGTYVLFGRVIVTNTLPSAQQFTATITTLDGATVLDQSDFVVSTGSAIAGNEVCVSLQAPLDLTNPTENEIVDIRCQASGGNAGANFARLYAIPVDAISPGL